MGYTPAFDTIYTGTLFGKWPMAAVWASLLPLVDAKGEINLSPEAIAGMTGWPLDLLIKGIQALCEPDPRSRSKAEDGRRLVLIDAARDWGWRVVNIGLYRGKASGLNQIADGRNAEKVRRYKERHRETPEDTDGHQETPQDTPDTHSYSDSYTNKVRSKNARKRAPSASTEFPLDFALDDAMRSRALSRFPDCDVDEAFAQFRAHHQASGSTFKSWPAAWAKWTGNFERFGYPKRKASGTAPGMERVRW